MELEIKSSSCCIDIHLAAASEANSGANASRMSRMASSK